MHMFSYALQYTIYKYIYIKYIQNVIYIHVFMRNITFYKWVLFLIVLF